MKFYVTYKIDARFVAEVEAENEAEARKKSLDNFMETDFGTAEDVSGYPIIVEDENENIVWEH